MEISQLEKEFEFEVKGICLKNNITSSFEHFCNYYSEIQKAIARYYVAPIKENVYLNAFVFDDITKNLHMFSQAHESVFEYPHIWGGVVVETVRHADIFNVSLVVNEVLFNVLESYSVENLITLIRTSVDAAYIHNIALELQLRNGTKKQLFIYRDQNRAAHVESGLIYYFLKILEKVGEKLQAYCNKI